LERARRTQGLRAVSLAASSIAGGLFRQSGIFIDKGAFEVISGSIILLFGMMFLASRGDFYSLLAKPARLQQWNQHTVKSGFGTDWMYFSASA